MTRESRALAGTLLVILPTVMFGGVTLLRFLAGREPGYADNPLRQDLWRAMAAILVPAAFFLSVLSPRATEPNALINLAYVGALVLAAGVIVLGVGLLRAARRGD